MASHIPSGHATPPYLPRFMELGAVADHSHEYLELTRVSTHGRSYGEGTRLQHWNQVKQVWEWDPGGRVGEIIKDLGVEKWGEGEGEEKREEHKRDGEGKKGKWEERRAGNRDEWGREGGWNIGEEEEDGRGEKGDIKSKQIFVR